MKKIIERTVRSNKKLGFLFNVNSKGGSLEAGMELGRIARQHEMLVRVETGAVCLSSCVYILAGGVARYVEGEVGIHSPYDLSEKSGEYEISKKKFDALRSRVKSYLNEMNVPDSLYDAMLQVPSHTIRILSEEELDHYGLRAEDPIYREAADIRRANKLGISREEYMKRKTLVEKLCTPLGQKGDIYEYAKCKEQVMKGN